MSVFTYHFIELYFFNYLIDKISVLCRWYKVNKSVAIPLDTLYIYNVLGHPHDAFYLVAIVITFFYCLFKNRQRGGKIQSTSHELCLLNLLSVSNELGMDHLYSTF